MTPQGGEPHAVEVEKLKRAQAAGPWALRKFVPETDRRKGRRELAFCSSHVRRRFYELFAADASPRLVPIKGEFLGVGSAGRPRRDDMSYYGDSIKNHGRRTS